MRNWILSPTGVVIDSTNKRSGDSSIKFTGVGEIRQVVTLEVNRFYNMSCYCNPSTATNTIIALAIYELAPEDDPEADLSTLTLVQQQFFDMTALTAGSWENRLQMTFKDSNIGTSTTKTYLAVFKCTSYAAAVNIDDVMLVRGEYTYPYSEHPTEYFFGDQILTELPAKIIEKYTVVKDQFRTDPDQGGKYFIRIGMQIDPSEPVYLVSDTNFNPNYTYDPLNPPTGNIIVNDSASVDFWRKYGDTRTIYLPSTFDIATITEKAYLYFKSSAVVVINGSLLAEGTVNADRLNVFELSAITADIGTITAGVLQSSDWGTLQGMKFDLNNKEIMFGGSSKPIFHYYYDSANSVWRIDFRGNISSSPSQIDDTLKEQLGAKYVTISASDAYFTYDPDTTTTAPASITLTATPTSSIVSPTYTWKKDGNVISGATSNTLVVNSSDFATSDLHTYTVEVEDTASTTGTIFSYTYTLLKIRHGTTGRVFNISPDSTFMVYNPETNANSPTSITITATKTNINGTVSWEKSTDNGTTWVSIGTGDQVTLNEVDFSSVSKIQIRATVTDADSGQVFTDYETVFKISEGADSVVAYLTNDAHVVAADPNGNVTDGFAGASTRILANRGGTALTLVSTAPTTRDQYQIATVTESTGVTGSLSGDTYTVTGLTTDSGTVTFTIKYLDANQLTKTTDVVFSISKAKQGTAGADGIPGASAVTYYLDLSSSTVTRWKDGNVTSVSPTSIVANAKTLDHATGTVGDLTSGKIKFYVASADTFVLYTTTTLSSTVTSATFPSSSYAGYNRIKVELTDTSDNVLDSEVIPILDEGTNVTVISLDNDTAAFVADADGVVPSSEFTNKTTKVTIYEGTTDVTSQYSISLTATSGITATYDSTTKTVSLTAFSQTLNSGEVIITASRTDYPTLTAKWYVTKVKSSIVKFLEISENKVTKTTAGTTVSYSPSSITATAKQINVLTGTASLLDSGTINFYYMPEGASTWTLDAAASVTLSSTVHSGTYSSFSGNKAIKVELIDSTNNLVDSETIPILAEGTDTVTIDLSNDSVTLPADSNGNITSFTGAATTVTIFEGTNDITSTYTLSVSSTYPATGVTYQWETDGVTLDITGVPSGTDSGYIEITATRTNYPTLTARWHWSKAKAGVDGTVGAQGPAGPAIQIDSSGFFFIPRRVTSAADVITINDFDKIDSYDPANGGINTITLTPNLGNGTTFTAWFKISGILIKESDQTSIVDGGLINNSYAPIYIHPADSSSGLADHLYMGTDEVKIRVEGTNNGVTVYDTITLYRRTDRRGYFLSENGSYFGSIQWDQAIGKEIKFGKSTFDDLSTTGFWLGVNSTNPGTPIFNIGVGGADASTQRYFYFTGNSIIINNIVFRSKKVNMTDTTPGYYFDPNGYFNIGTSTSYIQHNGTTLSIVDNYNDPTNDTTNHNYTAGTGLKIENGAIIAYGDSHIFGGPVFFNGGTSPDVFLTSVGQKLNDDPNSASLDKQYPLKTDFITDGQIHTYYWDESVFQYKEIASIGVSTSDQIDWYIAKFGYIDAPSGHPLYDKIGIKGESAGFIGVYGNSIHSYGGLLRSDNSYGLYAETVYGTYSAHFTDPIDISGNIDGHVIQFAPVWNTPVSTLNKNVSTTGYPKLYAETVYYPQLAPTVRRDFLHITVCKQINTSLNDSTLFPTPLVYGFPLQIHWNGTSYEIIGETFGFTVSNSGGRLSITHNLGCFCTAIVTPIMGGTWDKYAVVDATSTNTTINKTDIVFTTDSGAHYDSSCFVLLIPIQSSATWTDIYTPA